MNTMVDAKSRRGQRILRRVTQCGFWFFLIKGCLWAASFGAALFLARP